MHLEPRTFSMEQAKIMHIGSSFLKLQKIKQATFFWHTGYIAIPESLSRIYKRCISAVDVSALSELVLIAIHVDPDTVEKELRALVDVHRAVARRWNTDDILIMGDFNADGRFIDRSSLDDLQLRADTRTFTWLISDEVDTTTTDTDYTYDRSSSSSSYSFIRGCHTQPMTRLLPCHLTFRKVVRQQIGGEVVVLI